MIWLGFLLPKRTRSSPNLITTFLRFYVQHISRLRNLCLFAFSHFQNFWNLLLKDCISFQTCNYNHNFLTIVETVNLIMGNREGWGGIQWRSEFPLTAAVSKWDKKWSSSFSFVMSGRRSRDQVKNATLYEESRSHCWLLNALHGIGTKIRDFVLIHQFSRSLIIINHFVNIVLSESRKVVCFLQILSKYDRIFEPNYN